MARRSGRTRGPREDEDPRKPPLMSPTAERRQEAKRWRLIFVVAVLLALALFVTNGVLSEVRAGNVWGMSFGGAAALLLLVAALYGLRRRLPRTVSRHRLGSARNWLRIHTYGGSLFLLLVLFHTGWRFPTGAFNWWLWGLSLWTAASGFAGLALQRWIPKVLASGLAVEVLYERIPELIDDIRAKAQELVATCDEPVRVLYARQIAPALAAPNRRVIYYVDITGGIQSRLKQFRYLEGFLPADERRKLDKLEQLFRAKLEIDAHFTLQQALRVWLWTHVPTSFVLLALVILHVISAIYY